MTQTPSGPDRPSFDGNGAGKAPPPPPPPGYPPIYPAPDAGRRGGVMQRVVTGVVSSLLLCSLLLNVYLGAFFVSSMRGPTEAVYRDGDKAARIVILPIKGAIGDETAGFVHAALDKLKDDETIEALVLRVDSPGGGVSPSDRIYHELKLFHEAHPDVPIVASFGSVAASGGYYVSAQADYIFVEPTTITGSIGVIAQAFTVQSLMDKVGVTPEIIASTASTQKDTLSPFRAWTDKDRTELRVILDTAYERFVKVVSEGRAPREGREKSLTEAQVRQLATGAPYTGVQALENQLADEEGYLDAALVKAQALAGLGANAKPQIVVMGQSKGLGLMGLLGGHAPLPRWDANGVRELVSDLSAVSVEYRLNW